MTPSEFQNFATPHVVAMGLIPVLSVVLCMIARRDSDGRSAATIGYLLAAMLLASEVSEWGFRILQHGPVFFVKNYLPLHICSVASLATAATLIFRHHRIFEIAYFWGLVGSINAVITPGEIETGFPSWHFFQYFVAHGGIVVGVLYATWGLGMRPTLGSLLRAFVAVNVFAVAVGGINLLLGSNYMYLTALPTDTVSPFLFAPWPWYIPMLDAVALTMCFLVYLPVYLARRRQSQQIRRSTLFASTKPT